MKTAVVIPFRAREGGDPLRQQNLSRVVEHWSDYDCEIIISDDGRTGAAQFNRSAAYNRAAARGRVGATTADMLIFAESDLIVSLDQIDRAVYMAAAPGMVVPFSWFKALSEEDSRRVRAHETDPADCVAPVVKGHCGSIGAVNVLSRHTLDLIGGGYDEMFEGAWYDDDAMKIAFDVAAGPTRFVEGSGYHLYHLSGGRGDHLSRADRAATSRNRLRLQQYRRAHTPDQVRALVQEKFQ